MCHPAEINEDDSAGNESQARPSSSRPPSSRQPSSRPPSSRQPSGDPQSEIRSKPLIELLRIAEVQGVISGWSVNGPSLVLRRNGSHILVRAVDAASLLVRLMAEHARD